MSEKKTYPKFEFYWGLLSSLIVALAIASIQYFNSMSYLPYSLKKYEGGSLLGFNLLPFIGIYFIIGVIMLFFKKSEIFAKGLLLSALILLAIMYSLISEWIHL